MNIDMILYLLAFVFFIIEAMPIAKASINFMCLAFAALTLSLIV